jgi:hypothetical protein
MPISNEDFDKSIPDSPLLRFLKEHTKEAYSLEELTAKFGGKTYNELQYFVSIGMIQEKYIFNPRTNMGDSYFRIKISH